MDNPSALPKPSRLWPGFDPMSDEPPAASERAVLLLHFQPGIGFVERHDVDAIDEILADQEQMIWLDLQDPADEDLALLREEFRFHHLAIEDVSHRSQRPKIEQYEDTLFIVFYSAGMEAGRVVLRELAIFVGPNYLVTIHSGPIPEIADGMQRWRQESDRVSEGGPALVLHTLLDSIVDNYFPIVDEVADRIESIEDVIFAEAKTGSLRQIFTMKKDLLLFRRIVSPGRDVLNVLIRHDQIVVPRETHVYFQDIYDHILRVTDSIDTCRDMLITAVDIYLSSVSYRLNATVKRMTAITAILMTLALVAGIYGMNFQNMPELTWTYGYFAALGSMAAIAGVLAWYFRRIDWL